MAGGVRNGVFCAPSIFAPGILSAGQLPPGSSVPQGGHGADAVPVTISPPSGTWWSRTETSTSGTVMPKWVQDSDGPGGIPDDGDDSD